MKIIRNKRGFTLLELLISAAISVIIVGSALSVYLAQHKHLVIQDQISDMQQSVRAGMEELATKIRMAGYNVPPGISSVTAYNTNPDTIVVLYNTDALDNVNIDWPMPQPSAELRCDDDDLTPLHDGDWVFIYDPILRRGEFFLITNVQYGSGHIQHNTMPLDHCYPLGSTLTRIDRVKYFVDKTTDPNHPRLMVQYFSNPPQIYADNITDLQFQYVLSSGAIVNVPPVSNMIREVVINMTSRTERSDETFEGGYRTRNLQTKVKVRNLGIN
jgi:prepilin-type N-terminal cleavage/methylation domain-containing protein